MEVLLSGACYSRGLALNVMLYFTDRCSAQESIRSLNLTTLQESVIIESSDVDADHGVTVYEDTVYWTGNARVYSTPITGGGSQTELLHITSYGGAQFRGITVVHPDLQPCNVCTHSNTTALVPPPSTPLSSPSLHTFPPTTSHITHTSAITTSNAPEYATTSVATSSPLPSPPHSISPYLLFSTWFTVSRMNLDGSNYSVLVDPGSVGPQAVDYHWR